MRNIATLLADFKSMNLVYSPRILRINEDVDNLAFDTLLKTQKVDFVYDEIYGQLQELIKGFHPSIKIKDTEYRELIDAHLAGTAIEEYGVWVYYPWSRRLVHLLDEKEYIEVRTNRNQYKITREERTVLSEKRIGIIGLSVGQSIALTLAMERGFGELRLADFDSLELSNLNRIRTGVHNLAVPKAVITAREISEVDPFLKVTCFLEGLTEANMDEFFLKDGKLDILIDECDGLDIKLLSRYRARELKIPVLMDTSDRGMLDVERFDLEPNRPVLHGTVEDVNLHTIKDLTNEEKVPIILKMLGIENVSLKTKASMLEVQQSINTWPQLASSVALGGAVGADVCRRILLDEFHDSGRYYVDLEEIITDSRFKIVSPKNSIPPFRVLTKEEMSHIADLYRPIPQKDTVKPDEQVIRELVTAACSAPSSGNNQPWKWLYQDGNLFLFHDEHRSASFTDFKKTASYISLGAAYENLYIHAQHKGLEASYEFQPSQNSNLVAVITFKNKVNDADTKLAELNNAIFKRHTNRSHSSRISLDSEVFEELADMAESISGARFQCFTDLDVLDTFSRINGASERVRLFNPEGHYEFMHREARWTDEDAELTKDGVHIKSFGYSDSQLGALTIIKDENVISAINKFGGGKAFDSLGKTIVDSASALCLISFPEYKLENFFEGGRSMERIWLLATQRNLAIHPINSPLSLFARISHGKGEGLDRRVVNELKELKSEFDRITSSDSQRAEVFLAKIAPNRNVAIKTLRLPLEEVLVII